MTENSYPINKGINRSITFKGLKAQYIWYMGGGIFGVFILYVCMYMAKINTYLNLAITICAAALMMFFIYHLSDTYGENGLSKALARRRIPKFVKARSRKFFKK